MGVVLGTSLSFTFGCICLVLNDHCIGWNLGKYSLQTLHLLFAMKSLTVGQQASYGPGTCWHHCNQMKQWKNVCPSSSSDATFKTAEFLTYSGSGRKPHMVGQSSNWIWMDHVMLSTTRTLHPHFFQYGGNVSKTDMPICISEDKKCQPANYENNSILHCHISPCTCTKYWLTMHEWHNHSCDGYSGCDIASGPSCTFCYYRETVSDSFTPHFRMVLFQHAESTMWC